MSSTNRGAVRNPSDYYVTPHWCIEEFLRAWAADEPGLKQVSRILDPCAGGTEIDGKETVPMAYPEVLREFSPLFSLGWNGRVSTMDIRMDSRAEWRGPDYTSSLRTGLAVQFDLVISNPPFNLGRQFIAKALDDVAQGGFVAFLLRLNFFGAQSRKAWHQANMPYRCYVHSKRPSFAKGPTDSNEYAHFVWQKGLNNTETLLKVI